MTVPVGVVVPLAWATVAVSVTGEFCVIVLEEAVSFVDVLTAAAAFTVTVTALEVELLKLEAPE